MAIRLNDAWRSDSTMRGEKGICFQRDGPGIQCTLDAAVIGPALQIYASGRKSRVRRYSVRGRQRIVMLADARGLALPEAGTGYSLAQAGG